MAKDVVEMMLDNLPTKKRSLFNIYGFNTAAKSILPNGRSVGYDKKNVFAAINRLNTWDAWGGTDINSALTTVFNQRDAAKPRCSVVVITDGLDWGVTAAMQTIQKHATAAAEQGKLLRVFVMGLGDDVSRGMCEALVRSGSGATAYISDSWMQDSDHCELKAWTMINSINRAPIRVRFIGWGMTPAESPPQASGKNMASRPRPDQSQLGPAAKGDNVPPPEAIQQAPLPGTMFWAVRSHWYAIIDGTYNTPKVKIEYEIPGGIINTIEIRHGDNSPGRLVHSLAARALIQVLEDKAISITNAGQKYENEAEIVRLGKTYSLASTQTSFVATMAGVGTQAKITSNAPPGGRTRLSSVPQGDTASDLNFVHAQFSVTAQMKLEMTMRNQVFRGESLLPLPPSPPLKRTPLEMPRIGAMSLSPPLNDASSSDADSIASNDGEDDLSDLIAAQDATTGAFDPAVVERIVFRGVAGGIPAVAAAISALEVRDDDDDDVKRQVWAAICVIAFFERRHAEDSGEWFVANFKAEKFVMTSLRFGLGLDEGRAGEVFAEALEEAGGFMVGVV